MRVYFEKPRTTVGWKGLRIARKLLIDLNELGCIKNGTDGNRAVAINALLSVSRPHAFLGIDPEGRCALTYTKGNKHAHIVLRGGAAPNYDTVSVALTEQELERAKLARTIMIDCSHCNSGKEPTRQPLVFSDVIHQIVEGNRSIVGAMIEPNLE